MTALAVIFLLAASIVFVIDVAEQFGSHLATRVKWSAVWYAARYLGIITAALLALEVIAGEC